MHVLDASRVVGVVGSLLDGERRARARRGEPRRAGAPARRCTPRRSASRCFRSRAARANRTPHRLARARTSRRRRSPARGTSSRPSRSCAPYVDWTFFFHAWELKGRYPAILDDPEKGRRRASSSRPRTSCSTRSPPTVSSRPRGVYGFWPAARRGRRRRLSRTAIAVPDAAPAGRPRRLARRTARSPTSSRRADTALADHVGAFAVAIHGADELADALRGRARRLPRDHGRRRSPTGSPRRSPSGCTSARAASGTRPAERLDERRADRASATAGSARRSATRPARTTPRSGRCSRCSAPSRAGHRADRDVRDDPGGGASAASTSGTRRRGTSRSAGSAATRSRTTPRGRAMRRRGGGALASPEPRLRAVVRAPLGDARQAHRCRGAEHPSHMFGLDSGPITAVAESDQVVASRTGRGELKPSRPPSPVAAFRVPLPRDRGVELRHVSRGDRAHRRHLRQDRLGRVGRGAPHRGLPADRR